MSETETLLTVGELAARLTEPGSSPDPIATQLRNYAQRGLIHSFGMQKGSGRTAHRLYREDQWVVAKVLGILTEFGFADLSVLHATSVALNAWNFQDSPSARSPAQWVIDDFKKGVDFWTFDLALFRHVTKGGRDVRARIHNVKDGRGTVYGLGDEYIPRAVTMIDLTPHLNRLFGDKSGLH